MEGPEGDWKWSQGRVGHVPDFERIVPKCAFRCKGFSSPPGRPRQGGEAR
jgi:hypothetical protein